MADEPIMWQGDLEDDCTAFWQGMMLRAERMSSKVWWWAVYAGATHRDIHDANPSALGRGYWPLTGEEARADAEAAARELLKERKGA